MTSPSGAGSVTMASQQRTRSVPLCIGALAVALVGTAFCGYVIYKTAQVPVGDGSGMQWVVLTPLTLLFVGLVVPAFLFGMRGLRRPAASVPEALARATDRSPSGVFKTGEESRPQGGDLKVMLVFIGSFIVLVFFILPILFSLLG
jgi:hypothetical protein